MRVLVAPDALKGALSQQRFAGAVAAGLRRALADVEVIGCPLADGGEGTAAVVQAALGGQWIRVPARDAYGRARVADVLVLPDGTWVMEAAEGPGFVAEANRPRSAASTTSAGLGDMLAAAITGGAQRVWIGLGGTGSTDGGWGLLQALGAADGGVAAGPSLRLPACPVPLTAWCDVMVPATGPHGAVYRYGPQKGVAPDELPALAAAVDDLGAALEVAAGRALRQQPGAGAAGGAGMALAALGAQLVPGTEAVAGVVHLDDWLDVADVVVTGEGRLDESSLDGKVVGTVLAHARARGVPAVALVGECGSAAAMQAAYAAGLAAAYPLALAPRTRADAMAQSAYWAEEAASHMGPWLARWTR